ncbi:unnamed protein product [Choristocarpus tenellus]
MRSVCVFVFITCIALLVGQILFSSIWIGPEERISSRPIVAYVVAFTDPDDPFVLERAAMLHQSLIEALLSRGSAVSSEEILALVPRIPSGDKLVGPLEAMGYSVLKRDPPVAVWRMSDRFLQLTMCQGNPRGDGGGESGGHGILGWDLLKLEALSFYQYNTVVVLDQLAILFPSISPSISEGENIIDSASVGNERRIFSKVPIIPLPDGNDWAVALATWQQVYPLFFVLING